MKIVVGLGNPGKQYAHTPHNAGFDVVDVLAAEYGVKFRGSLRLKAHTGEIQIGETRVLLVKPDTFMNASGEAVAAILRRSPAVAEDVLVVLDDADLPLGRLRIRVAGSSGGHRGLASITASLGSEAVARIRVGVGRGATGERDLVNHVLSKPAPGDRELLVRAVEVAARAVVGCVRDGVPAAMNEFNGLKIED